MSERIPKNIPEWAKQERTRDLAWIGENLHLFWPAAQSGFAEVGRGAIVSDTTTLVVQEQAQSHPFAYVPAADIEKQKWQDVIRLVRQYEPRLEFVAVLLKEQRESAYRIQVPNADQLLALAAGMMPQGAAPEEIKQHVESILEKKFVEVILQQARENLQKDGSLVPVLFLNLQDGQQALATLTQLPGTPEEKQLYFAEIGSTIRQGGQNIDEAVFLSESWYVDMQKGGNLALPPRQHPQRQEAIMLVGRNADRSRFTMVVQPFGRDRRNRPVFGKIELASYNQAADREAPPVGLLDYLFPGPLFRPRKT